MYRTNTKSILSDFLRFLKKPNDQQVNLSTKERLLVILQFLILKQGVSKKEFKKILEKEYDIE